MNDAPHTEGGMSGQAHASGGKWSERIKGEILSQLTADIESRARERDSQYTGPERRGNGNASDSGASGPFA